MLFIAKGLSVNLSDCPIDAAYTHTHTLMLCKRLSRRCVCDSFVCAIHLCVRFGVGISSQTGKFLRVEEVLHYTVGCVSFITPC